MTEKKTPNISEVLRLLPSIDDLLESDAGRQAAASVGRERSTELAREATAALRRQITENTGHYLTDLSQISRQAFLDELSGRLDDAASAAARSRLRRVINATGVVLHTNLGRAPLSREAAAALAEEVSGYCNLEYDVETGKRGRRGRYAEDLAARLAGAESAAVVNNCAAAALLVLSVLAAGREVIVSRGELVEIGGDFRVPDVLARSGAVLREVGTTNRTKLADYERAITPNTALIVRVHPSNYRIIGFTETPPLKDLAELAHRSGLLIYEDAGSGALLDLGEGLSEEPIISRSIEAGADLVTFSGDKLLGGPQAGIIAGKRELVGMVRRHPLYRALRAGKLIYAALAATLESYARGSAVSDIPVLRMLKAGPEELGTRSGALADAIRNEGARCEGLEVEVIEGLSAVGGGAAPGFQPATSLVVINHPNLSAAELERKLRLSDPPVVARISEDRLLIDLRTVSEQEEGALLRVVTEALISAS